MGILITDMLYMIGEEVIAKSGEPVWVTHDTDNTTVKLYCVDLDDGEVGYMAVLEMFGIVAWYGTVMYLSEVTGDPKLKFSPDFDMVSQFSALKAEHGMVALYLSKSRSLLSDMAMELASAAFPPYLIALHMEWCDQQQSKIGEAIENWTYNPFSKFIDEELDVDLGD